VPKHAVGRCPRATYLGQGDTSIARSVPSSAIKIVAYYRLALVVLFSFALGACGGGGGGKGGSSPSFTIGGTVTGLASNQQIVLRNNSADALKTTADGPFTFATAVADGGSYSVNVQTQPAGQTCVVTNGTGSNVVANIRNVAVSCSTNTYVVGGSLKGLDGLQQVSLQNNGGDTLTLMTNGSFVFSVPVAYGGAYRVSVSLQPSQQFCKVSQGSGTVAGPVTSVQILCGSDETVLHEFTGMDGATPKGNLIMDKAGNLYGTTYFGGSGTGHGNVFELSPTGVDSVLYTFGGGNDGAGPRGGLIMDNAGNLYGTTSIGGAGSCAAGCGTVFKLTLATGGGYSKTVLYSFTGGSDGGGPDSGLIMDGAGNLYGTTSSGSGDGVTGTTFAGTVFRLSPVSGGGYTESVLHVFQNGVGNDGTYPAGGLIMDKMGNLYGTTSSGGSLDSGAVFELSPAVDGSYAESLLYSFGANGPGGMDGLYPSSGVVFDSANNLYGMTVSGGSNYFGTVFKLSPATGGGYTESILYDFSGMNDDGGNPSGGIIIDGTGNLYGTTQVGGGAGTVFKLAPTSNGDYTGTILYSFLNGPDGADPGASLVMDNAGNLFGTAQAGGIYNLGNVFEITLH
jgi:uncharacterized repeat protein (TIGR03803 family)